MQSEILDEICFHAEIVDAHEEEYTTEFIVHGIYFGEGDPEQGGQHWNFTQTPDDDDDRVCTVKEIQAVTVYGGIDRFNLTRQGLVCEFNEQIVRDTKTHRIVITYTIDDETWKALVLQAKKIFAGESYFSLNS